MEIICIDSDKSALKNLTDCIKTVCPIETVNSFYNAADAIDFAKQQLCDVAFLDVHISDMNGVELAEMLKKINTKINIIFTTDTQMFTREAWAIHASGYILKPITVEKIQTEISNLRSTPLTFGNVFIQTFGNFEVFVNDKPINFTRKKAKELLAYLVDRKCALVSYRELRAILWEDEPDDATLKNKFRVLLSELRKTLESQGIADIIIKKGYSIGLDINKIRCDFYDYLKHDPLAEKLFQGEYMSQYSWAEFTLGSIL